MLTILVQRKPLLHAVAFGVGATLLAYLVFSTLLNAPRGAVCGIGHVGATLDSLALGFSVAFGLTCCFTRSWAA